MKKKTGALISIIFALIIGTMSFGACSTEQSQDKPSDDTANTNAPKKLEYGFSEGGGCLPSEAEKCAYKADTDTFDIDDVTVTFYFGLEFSISVEDQLKSRDVPEFDVYFADEKYNPIHMVRHSTENFISEEYRVTSLYHGDDFNELVYNHAEEITIPRALFVGEQGVIRLCVGGINIKEHNPQYKAILFTNINYDMINENTVKLSRWDGKRK